MDALDLYVVQRVRIDRNAGDLLYIVREFLLVGDFYRLKLSHEIVMGGERLELPQGIQPHAPIRAQMPVDEAGESGICQRQPAARCNAVGAINKPARQQFVKISEYGFLQQLRVQFGNAIDFVARQHTEMCHAHTPPAVFVDDGNTAQQIVVAGVRGTYMVEKQFVDVVNDLHVTGQYPFQEIDRPRFQGFGHQGVVGVRENARTQAPRQRPWNMMYIHQQAHQFGNRNGRVGIIEMNSHFIRQLLHTGMFLEIASQQILQRSADEEVFLAQAQFAAQCAGVVRVQHPRDIFGMIFTFDCGGIVALIKL